VSKPDDNFLSIPDEPFVGERFFTDLIPLSRNADTLKFSNSQNGVIRGRRIVGGYEDCVDCNRGCANLDVHFDVWEPRGKAAITDKGGSRDNRFSGVIICPGTECEVDIGNWSDQSEKRTTGTRLNLRMADGSKVRVRVLNGWVPIFENGVENYVVNDAWKGIFIHVWKILKCFGLG